MLKGIGPLAYSTLTHRRCMRMRQHTGNTMHVQLQASA